MAGRRYAVTGPNGAGKSTFMKILTGEIDSTSGSITRPKKMGVLRPGQFAFDEYRVVDTVVMGNATLWKALEERDALYAKPHGESTDADGVRLGELEGIVGDEGGYTADAVSADTTTWWWPRRRFAGASKRTTPIVRKKSRSCRNLSRGFPRAHAPRRRLRAKRKSSACRRRSWRGATSSGLTSSST